MLNCCPTVLSRHHARRVCTGHGYMARSHMTVSVSAAGACRRLLTSVKSLVDKVDDVPLARDSCSSASPARLVSHFAVAGEHLLVLDARAKTVIRLANLGAAISASLNAAQASASVSSVTRRAQFWEVDKPAVLRRKRGLMGKVLPQQGLVRSRLPYPMDIPPVLVLLTLCCDLAAAVISDTGCSPTVAFCRAH